MSAGHWVALIAGPSIGWDRTAIGVVVYDGDGNLAGSKFDTYDRARHRGDLGDWSKEWVVPEPPATWAAMEDKLGRIGNAMSSIRWDGGFGTLAWDQEMIERLYENVVEGTSR